jgi:death-on-curing protein
MPEIEYLDLHDLLFIAGNLIPGVQVRDRGLLHSAVERPRAILYGEEAYPTFEEKAAALLHSIARNHALLDGNKRLAWAATRAFCLLNNRDIALGIDEAEKLVVNSARGEYGVSEISKRLNIVFI